MSLQSKAHLLAKLKPTIAILPESAHPDRTGPALEAIGATSVQWIGSNLNKGLSAVAFAGWKLRIDDSYDPGYHWVMPLHLSGPREIRVLAVWDMNHRGHVTRPPEDSAPVGRPSSITRDSCPETRT
jgi:hypothetical protein